MSEKKREKLLAEDFIKCLGAVMPTDELVKILAKAKKGADVRFENILAPSWHAVEIKKIRGQLIFGKWSWINGGMFRQSWDGTVSQDVHFFYSDSQMRLSDSPETQRAYRLLEKLANKAVANCDGEAEIDVVLTSDQIRVFFAEEGGVK